MPVDGDSMKVRRFAAMLLASSIGLAWEPATACSYIMPPEEETADSIASRGAVIRGTVVQKIDVRRQKPLIIRADQVFVGDKTAQLFVIYNTPREYELLRRPSAARDSCDHPAKDYALGLTDLFVLEPVPKITDAATGRWRFSLFGPGLLQARSRPMLTKMATRMGRLQSPLPTVP